MHVVLGEGSITKKELEHQINELWEAATATDADFWFLLEAKETPTEADKALVKFLSTSAIHHQVLIPEGVTPDDLYDSAAERHDTEGDWAESVVEAMQSLPEGEEGADLLALFVDPANEVPEDAELIGVIEAAINAGIEVFGLNDSMEPVTFDADEPEEPPVPPPTPAKASKTASKKAAPQPAAEPEDDTTPAAPVEYTRVELEGMTPPEVKAIASGMGLSAKNKAGQIDLILAGQEQGPPAGVNPGAAQNNSPLVAAAATSTNAALAVSGDKAMCVVVFANGSIVAKFVDAAAAQALLS